jgi:hypothetical protein
MDSLAYRCLNITDSCLPTPLDATHLSIIKNIFFFPISWRKYIVAFCRTQVPIMQLSHLLSEFGELSPDSVMISIPNIIDTEIFKQDLVTPLSDLLYSPIYLSFVSYLCRAENTYHISEFLEQRNISFTKEFLATTTPTKPQQLNYVGLLTGSSNEPHMHSMICSTDLSMPHNLLNAYRSKILRLKDKLETYLGKLMLITWTYLLVCRLFMNLFRVNSGICICR